MKGIPSRDHLESVLLQSGLDFPASYVEFGAAPLMMLVMEKLTCLMALPESLAHSLSERGLVEITNLRLPTLLDNFGLIWNKQIALGPSAQAFRNTFVTLIEQHSGQPVDVIEKDSDRDYWMIAAEAKAYGMIDEVLVRNNK